MKKMLLAILVLGLLPLVAAAQDATPPETNPVSNMVKLVLARSAKNIVAAAEEMPADKYGYKPTPAQMTFGEIVLHIAQDNDEAGASRQADILDRQDMPLGRTAQIGIG